MRGIAIMRKNVCEIHNIPLSCVAENATWMSVNELDSCVTGMSNNALFLQ